MCAIPLTILRGVRAAPVRVATSATEHRRLAESLGVEGVGRHLGVIDLIVQ